MMTGQSQGFSAETSKPQAWNEGPRTSSWPTQRKLREASGAADELYRDLLLRCCCAPAWTSSCWTRAAAPRAAAQDELLPD